jgi:ech hydrogenase subunit D
MIEEQPLESIEAQALPERAASLKAEGFRLVQVSCTSQPDGRYEITYSFDRDYKLLNLRCYVPRQGASVPSITPSYLAAFAYENELQDLFGVKVPGLLVDYQGKFYRMKEKSPMAEPYSQGPAPAKPAAPPAGAVADPAKEGN